MACDVVAYAADPVAKVDMIRGAGIHVVMGNCEEFFGQNANDCACGFASGSTCDRLSVAGYVHADRRLNHDARAWILGRPRRIDFIAGSHRLAVIHGSAASINQFVFASAPDATFRTLLKNSGCDAVIGGHCGIPFTRQVDGMPWHNPGAVGVPANGGTPRAWLSVLRPHNDCIELTHHPLDHDHNGAAASMRQAGLPDGDTSAMLTGLWPGTDMLPPAEPARTGVPLEPGLAAWPANTVGSSRG